MNTDPDDFPDLEPPAGGLSALRARLDRPRRPWRLLIPLPLLAAAALVAAVLWPRPRTELPLDAALLAWVAPPSAPVTAVPGADGTPGLERVPSDVVWYRVTAPPVVAPPRVP